MSTVPRRRWCRASCARESAGGRHRRHQDFAAYRRGERHAGEGVARSALLKSGLSTVRQLARRLSARGRYADARNRSWLFGVAGPIRQEQGYRTAQITHLPWLLDERKLSTLSGIPAMGLINDFEAIGFGVAGLAPQHLHTLQEGDGRAGDDMRLIVGAGTGLGVAQLLRHGNRTRVLASQGGHVGYAPGDALEDALLHYLRPREV